MLSLKRTLLAGSIIATSFLSVASAWAGEQYLDANGFAVNGYDVVAYFSLKQNPVGSDQPRAVPGLASITAQHNGATWAFSSKENRATFLADPEKYAPQYDGHCAYGVAKGGKVPGNPHLWRILDGKLYLNITQNVVSFWEEDIPGNLKLSESNWQKIEGTPRSKNKIPNFDANVAPQS